MPATKTRPDVPLRDQLRAAAPAARWALLEKMTLGKLLALRYDWSIWVRPSQEPPPEPWTVWLVLTGRGWGKTRIGAEHVRAWAEAGDSPHIALVAETAADARDVMVEGELSGILAVSPHSFRPLYEPSKRRLTWPNGVTATTYSADDPEQLRGPQHYKAWCDEIGKWRYGPETWDNLMMGMRLGPNPQVVATSTPRPVKLVRDLVKREGDGVVVTRGHTFENLSNLSPAFRQQVVARYEGTRIGRQELAGELLEDVPGALWTRAMIDADRVTEHPELHRIAVAIDPAVTSGEESDETGIMMGGKGVDGHAYILADASGRFTPLDWARRALWLYKSNGADRIVAEVNNGGDMVESTIRTTPEGQSASYKAVHASRGKRVRAEPIAALYEQHKIHHVGAFEELEDQQVNFTPDGYEGSPDRLDALVWLLTELMLDGGEPNVRWLA